MQTGSPFTNTVSSISHKSLYHINRVFSYSHSTLKWRRLPITVMITLTSIYHASTPGGLNARNAFPICSEVNKLQSLRHISGARALSELGWHSGVAQEAFQSGCSKSGLLVSWSYYQVFNVNITIRCSRHVAVGVLVALDFSDVLSLYLSFVTLFPGWVSSRLSFSFCVPLS